VVASTVSVLTVKVALVAPLAKVTVDGTVAAAVLLLVSVTRRCVVVPAAGAVKVTVAVELAIPPRTLVGFSVMEATCGGVRIRVSVLETPLLVAVMVTVVVDPTEMLVTVKVALVAPAGMVTLAGVVVDALLSDKVTTAPAASAGLSSVTVPVEERLPRMLLGVISTLRSVGGLIVMVEVRVTAA